MRLTRLTRVRQLDENPVQLRAQRNVAEDHLPVAPARRRESRVADAALADLVRGPSSSLSSSVYLVALRTL